MTEDQTPADETRDGMPESRASTEERKSPDLVLDGAAVDEGDEVSRMSLSELMEAAEDEAHPRHEEALQRSKQLAESLRPALQSLQSTVSAQLDKAFEGIKLPTTRALGLDMSESLSKIQASIPNANFLLKTDWQISLPPHLPPVSIPDVVTRPDIEAMTESLAAAAREREERAERQVELAAKQVEALGAVAAQLQQLNRRMESVDQRLDQSHRSSGRSFGWTITVGASTLVATIVGIVVAVVLSHG